MRKIGTVSRGIRLPIVVKGDDIVNIVADAIMEASESDYESFFIRDSDVIGVTESLVARAQGNYATLEDISNDIRNKIPDGDVAVLFPIMSRNRFYPILKGIAGGVSGTIHVVFSYPNDEVGNQIVDPKDYYTKQSMLDLLNSRSFDEATFRSIFGQYAHPFTGVDYIELYKSVDPGRVTVHFSDDPAYAVKLAKSVIVGSIHARSVHKDVVRHRGGLALGLDDICTKPLRDGMGYNEKYGLLGSNYTSDESIKLFPRDCDQFVEAVQAEMERRTGKKLEVLVYGDGAFKDPVCGIWELADPVVSPAFTPGLAGTPNEIKLKYVADSASEGVDRTRAVSDAISAKKAAASVENTKVTLGTTPRQIPDLIGSLCDLTSGSGDKGTPVVYVSGYFSSYIDD